MSREIRAFLVGKPNVGKTTLFRVLTKEKGGIIYGEPGTTRDYLTGRFTLPSGKKVLLYDLCGFERESEDPVLSLCQKKQRSLWEEGDLFLFVGSAREGISAMEEDLLKELRKYGRPILLLVNKVDHPSYEEKAQEFLSFSLPTLFISAAHRKNIQKIVNWIDQIVEENPSRESSPNVSAKAKKETTQEEENPPFRIAIMGRPNAGKSTLFNTLLKQDRAIIHPMPGTTRDLLVEPVSLPGISALLEDTPGIRRKTRIDTPLEKISVSRTLHHLEEVDIVLYLVSSLEGIVEQDQRILRKILSRGKGTLLIFSLWDKVEDKEYRKKILLDQKRYRFSTFEFLPHIFLSSYTGEGIKKIPYWIRIFQKELTTKVSTSVLNRILRDLTKNLSLPALNGRKGKEFRILYGTQTGIRPVRIRLFTNISSLPPPHYMQHIQRILRKNLPFSHIPILLEWEKKS